MYASILSQHIASPLNKFNQQIQKTVEPLVNTAIVLHQKVVHAFLPTAIKFHYVFNLRDLTNIFQVIFQLKSLFGLKKKLINN